MQVEHITGVSLAPRRTAQEQGDRTVRLSLLAQVIEYDKHVLAVIHPVLADSRAGIWSNVFETCRIRSGGSYDSRIFHGAGIFQRSAHSSDRRAFLANSHINAAHLFQRVA